MLTSPPRAPASSRTGARCIACSPALSTSRPSAHALPRSAQALQKDEAKFAKKLSNPGFLAKAAPEIVEKDTAKLAELRDKLARVEEQLAELG